MGLRLLVCLEKRPGSVYGSEAHMWGQKDGLNLQRDNDVLFSVLPKLCTGALVLITLFIYFFGIMEPYLEYTQFAEVE